jgi:hypothetical protein
LGRRGGAKKLEGKKWEVFSSWFSLRLSVLSAAGVRLENRTHAKKQKRKGEGRQKNGEAKKWKGKKMEGQKNGGAKKWKGKKREGQKKGRGVASR